MIQLAIQGKQDIEQKQVKTGMNALLLASKNDRLEAVQFIVSSGASLEATDAHGVSNGDDAC